MCGIVGHFNNNDAVKNSVKGLKIIKNRGKDGFGIAIDSAVLFNKSLNKLTKAVSHLNSNNAMGHCLHSVVGFLPQPMISDKTKAKFVINCEIYNWTELNEKYKFNAKNDSELVLKLIEKNGLKNITKTLNELDGVYSFAYWYKNKVYVARDIIGIKPLWYSLSDGFAFCSEKKALINNGLKNIEELNPRKVMVCNVKTRKIEFITRKYFTVKPEIKKSKKQITKELTGLITKAITKRIPDKEFGILFSGGVDSTTIALMCKKLGLKPICYTAAVVDKNMPIAEDLVYAKKVAKKFGLKLKVNKISLKDVEKYLKKVLPLIEDNNVVKAGVALTFYAACELAKKDNVKVIFSGLGNEEIFAGYQRHKNSLHINKECLSGLIKMYERDLYRDDVVTMNNNIELRLPFLDKELVKYALKIPAKYKLNKDKDKLIFREIAEINGLDKEFAYRGKKAAQYGSRIDKAFEKLAKKQGFRLKSEYLKQFYIEPNLKLGVLFSSGKDSTYAMAIMQRQNYEISCLITIKSKNKASYMFHTPNIDLAKMQAKAMGLPIIEQTTAGDKEKELVDLKKALEKAKKKFGIEGVVTGALFSNYQRERVEKVCDELGLKIFSPLWHMEQETLMRELIKNNFEVIISSIAGDGLSKKYLGAKIDDKMLNNLIKLNQKNGINVAFEGGEAESLVLNAPMFKKKIKIEKADVKMENECTGFYVVKKAKLVKK